MNNRERIIKTLLCQKTDRPPFVLWLGYGPWGQTLERWRKESGIADLTVARYFGFEPFDTVAPIEYGPFPHFERKVLETTDEFVTAVDFRGIVFKNFLHGGSMPEYLDRPVHSPEEWLRYKEERLQPRLEDRLTALDAWAEKAEKIDAIRQVGNYPWGVFGTTRDLLGTQDLLMDFYDQENMVRDIMRTYVDLWLALYERIADRIELDCIHIWEDMSYNKGSLISMPMVEEFMMPHYDRIVEFARRRNIPLVSVDSDGLVDQLVPTMMKHGINVYFPFEVQAGNDVVAYGEQYPGLGILGGLDKKALAAGKKGIHVELDKAERMFARGGYISGFDHLIPPDVPWENFKYAVEHIKRLTGI